MSPFQVNLWAHRDLAEYHRCPSASRRPLHPVCSPTHPRTPANLLMDELSAESASHPDPVHPAHVVLLGQTRLNSSASHIVPGESKPARIQNKRKRYRLVPSRPRHLLPVSKLCVVLGMVAVRWEGT